MVPIGQVDNLRRELAEIDILNCNRRHMLPNQRLQTSNAVVDVLSGLRERGDNEFPGIEFPLNDFLAFPFKNPYSTDDVVESALIGQEFEVGKQGLGENLHDSQHNGINLHGIQ